MNGPLEDTLCRAREMVKSEGMSAALDEVSALQKVLGDAGSGLRLDLSLGGEMEYYNGLVFNGYLQGLPRAVVRGGRYDLLARRFTPGAGAIGFAVYVDLLQEREQEENPFDVDTLILHDGTVPLADLRRAAESAAAEGSVLVATKAPKGRSWKRKVEIKGGAAQ